MLEKTKNIALKLLPRKMELSQDDVKEAREYIANYWQKLERFNPKDTDNLIGLPKPYLVPSFEESHKFDYDELYYWDSYFMIQGMLDAEHKEMVLGILDDLVYLYERFKIIPNASRLYLTSRSQPPLLTSFIWDVYAAYKMDKKWLKKMMKVAEEEYKTVWMGTRKPHDRLVHEGLSRYYDFNYLHDIAETESGWDMTPRFGRKALNYLPADLNSLLYKYEVDLAKFYRLLDDKRSAAAYEVAAEHRKISMNKLMWSNMRGIYFDYNYAKQRRGTVSSLAGYYPLWAGMVDEEKAASMVNSLRRFEHRGGLSATDTPPLNQIVPGMMPTQWAHPNGWAPLHYLIVKGLQRYGYEQDARRIAMKWLNTNLNWYKQHGVFLEKYNVVNTDKPPVKGIYPSQTGFGWTNAVFERFCQEFID